MSNDWSEERRVHQAAMIQKWKPWQYSTGAKSCEGKQRSAQNAYKGGKWRLLREEIKRLNKLMKDQKIKVEEIHPNHPVS